MNKNIFEMMTNGNDGLEQFHNSIIAGLMNPEVNGDDAKVMFVEFVRVLKRISCEANDRHLLGDISFCNELKVDVEHQIKRAGRADVVIAVKGDWIIIIESKINGAKDGKDQIEKYIQGVKGGYDKVVVVYLTRFDENGFPLVVPGKVKNIQNRLIPLACEVNGNGPSLIEWLENAKSHVSKECARFIGQYISFLRWDFRPDEVKILKTILLRRTNAVFKKRVITNWKGRTIASFQRFDIWVGKSLVEFGIDVTVDPCQVEFFVREDKSDKIKTRKPKIADLVVRKCGFRYDKRRNRYIAKYVGESNGCAGVVDYVIEKIHAIEKVSNEIRQMLKGREI